MPVSKRLIELLAPAKNLECGLAAINHGADAVYIGAADFGARKSAANPMEHIEQLVQHAHLYGAKVFVTLNTLIFDHEMDDAIAMAWQLYRVGVDALIIQDLGLLEAGLPPMAIHASTQMDNRTPQKVRFLQEIGFEQVVLARELNLGQIAQIKKETDVALEYFVHGALCVSYSGQCYMSQSINGRSANRGECAQPCRLPYNMIDGNGRTIVNNKHLLSMKDLNLSDNLESLIDAGISSFKIEGRLKDKDYVANITAHYRQRIDAILERKPELKRVSSGKSIPQFTPDPFKSFNRGFTSYFVNDRQKDIWSINSPKAIGEPMGEVETVAQNSFKLKQKHDIANGDGLCFFDANGQLHGIKVNRVENGLIFPLSMEKLSKGTTIYRNYNHLFSSIFKKETAQRKIGVKMYFEENPSRQFTLHITDEDGIYSQTSASLNVQEPRNSAQAADQTQKQLAKTGNTPFELTQLTVKTQQEWFIPTSELNALRRQALEVHAQKRIVQYRPTDSELPKNQYPYPEKEIQKNGNVINRWAEQFFNNHGATVKEYGYELQKSYNDDVVMTTKHCILHEQGNCLKLNPSYRKNLPIFISNDKDLYELKFNCKECEMVVIRRKKDNQPGYNPSVNPS